MSTPQPPGGDSSHAAGRQRGITSWVSACPGGLWEVQRRGPAERKKGFETPALGSVCKVRVQLKGHPALDSEPQQDSSSQPSSENQQQDTPSQQPSDDNKCEGDSSSPSVSVLASSWPRTPDSVLQIPVGQWVQLVVGEGQCDVIEGCLEGMKAGEECEFQVRPHSKDATPKLPDTNKQAEGHQDADASAVEEGSSSSSSSPSPHHHWGTYRLELHSFSLGKESWEMTSAEKWTWVKAHKERGSQRFGKGDVWGASDCYCRAVKLLITLTERKNGQKKKKGMMEALEEGSSPEEESDAVDTTEQQRIPTEEEYNSLKAELHSNLALCQLKLNQPGKARASSQDATQLDPLSTKAWYRLGQASLLVGELQDARRAFGKVLELQPNSAAARQGLKQVNSKEKDVNNKLGQRLSKMFT